MAKYGTKIKENAFETKLGGICNLMAYYEIYSKGNTKKLLELIYSAKSYKEVFTIKKIIPAEIEKEIDYYYSNFRAYSNFFEDSIIIFLKKPKFMIGAILSTRLSLIFPHKTIIVMQNAGKRIFVNGRRADFKIAVNELFEKSIVNLKKASAGGHIPAAGASLRKEDYKIFYKNLMENIKAL